ncbi:MAG: type II secretion system protein GspM [Methylococcaceae bacterium]
MSVNFNDKQIQRWSAVALLVFLLLVMGLLIVMPIINKGLELHEEKGSLLFRLQQYERILAKKDAVLESMEQIKEQHAEQNYFNTQETDSLASAEMQAFIKQAIVEAGGVLSSTQALPINNSGKFSRITISVRMTGNSEMLRAVLYKIETNTPFIIINQIDIRPMRGRINPTTRKVEPSNQLNINFQAVSFMRKKTEP